MAFSDILSGLFNLGPSQEAAPSAQLRSSSGVSRDIPQYTPPAPQPQQQQQQSGGQQKQNGGWYNGVQYWAPGQGPQTQSVGVGQQVPSGPSEEDLNNIYNPLNQAADATISYLNQQLPTDEAAVEAARARQEATIEKQRGLFNEQSTQDQTYLGEEKQSALQAAIRAYNALNQQRQARFGGSTSAGQAVGELATQEFFRSNADMEKTYAREITGLLGKRKMAQMFYDDEINRANEIATTELSNIRKEYRAAILGVENDKREIASRRAERKLQIDQDYRARIENTKNTLREYLMGLEQVRMEREQEVGRQIADKEAEYAYQRIINLHQGDISSLTGLSKTPMASTTPSQVVQPGRRYYNQNDDEFFGV